MTDKIILIPLGSSSKEKEYVYDPRDWAQTMTDEDGVFWIELTPTREGQKQVIIPVHPNSKLAELYQEVSEGEKCLLQKK